MAPAGAFLAMDNDLKDDEDREAEKHPVAHGAEVVADTAAKTAAGLLGIIAVGLFALFLILSLVGVFFMRG